MEHAVPDMRKKRKKKKKKQGGGSRGQQLYYLSVGVQQGQNVALQRQAGCHSASHVPHNKEALRSAGAQVQPSYSAVAFCPSLHTLRPQPTPDAARRLPSSSVRRQLQPRQLPGKLPSQPRRKLLGLRQSTCSRQIVS